MTTNLRSLWEINHRWRAWMHENTGFKTPDTLDCLRYSVCEAGEALDSWMRQKNQHHARNNGREHTVEQELADVAMLLLTALPEEAIDPQKLCRPDNPKDLDYLCYLTACAANLYGIGGESGEPLWYNDAHMALNIIFHYPGFNLSKELGECHRRLARKHGLEAYVIGLQLNCEAEPWIIFDMEVVAHD